VAHEVLIHIFVLTTSIGNRDTRQRSQHIRQFRKFWHDPRWPHRCVHPGRVAGRGGESRQTTDMDDWGDELTHSQNGDLANYMIPGKVSMRSTHH
jgi:hypothetical protein